MKCQNCFNTIKIFFQCKYCSKNFCSLSCLEFHYSNYHIINNNNCDFFSQHQNKVNSPFYVKGVLKNSIDYNSIYSLKNFFPVYEQDGKIKIIGSGSFGQVYLGLNTIKKSYYAIKHMDKKNIISLLHSLTGVQKEIEIQSKIEHPNIVKLLYVKETDISYDLVMEYAPKGNLFHYIRKNKGLNEDVAFNLFIQVVNAINFLHENDLIHRDIKPENILMFENNIVKLCDFGWCVKLNGEQRGTFCGTTEYMSPELVNNTEYGKEIDVWSLGVLLYEMIHGYSPFRPNKPNFDDKDVMENIINHNLKFEKKISPQCKKLIYGLLEPNIVNRYKVEDIYNSEYVKKYEQIQFGSLNNKQKFINLNQIPAQKQINNIIYSSQIEMNNNINIHMPKNMSNYIYNIEIPGNKIYNYNESSDLKERNQDFQNFNIDIYPINASLNNQGNFYSKSFIYNTNYYLNNIESKTPNLKSNEININSNKDCISNQKKLINNKTLENFYPINIWRNREQELINIYSNSNNTFFQNDCKRDNKEFINFNNSILFLSGQNNNNITKENIKINNKLRNNNLQLDKFNSKLLQNKSPKKEKEKIEENINEKKIGNLLYTKNITNIDNHILNDNYNNELKNQLSKNNILPSKQSLLAKSEQIIQKNNNSNINNKFYSRKCISPISSISKNNISDEKNKKSIENLNKVDNNNITNKPINNNKIIRNQNISEFKIENNNQINYTNEKKNDNMKIEINSNNDSLNYKKSLSTSNILYKDILEKRIKKEKEPIDNINGKRKKKKSEEKVKIKGINIVVNFNDVNDCIKNSSYIPYNPTEESSNFSIIKSNKISSVCNIENNENKKDNENKINNQIYKNIDYDYSKEPKLKKEELHKDYLLPKSKSFDNIQKIKKKIKNKNNKNKDNNNLSNDINQNQKINKYLNKTKIDYNYDSEINKNIKINKNENIGKENYNFSKKENINKDNVNYSMIDKIPIEKNIFYKSNERLPKDNKKNKIKKALLIPKSPETKHKLQKINKFDNNNIFITRTPITNKNYPDNINYKKTGNYYIRKNKVDNKDENYLKISKASNDKKKSTKIRLDLSKLKSKNNNKKNDEKKEIKKLLKPSYSFTNIKEKDKIKINNIKINTKNKKIIYIKNNKLKDISNDSKLINKKIFNINKNNKKIEESNKGNITSDYIDISDDRNITPKKKYIFNKVKPNKLIENFKKEKSKQEKKDNILKLQTNI